MLAGLDGIKRIDPRRSAGQRTSMSCTEELAKVPESLITAGRYRSAESDHDFILKGDVVQ